MEVAARSGWIDVWSRDWTLAAPDPLPVVKVEMQEGEDAADSGQQQIGHLHCDGCLEARDESLKLCKIGRVSRLGLVPLGKQKAVGVRDSIVPCSASFPRLAPTMERAAGGLRLFSKPCFWRPMN